MSTKEFDKAKSKISNFHSEQSVIIAKLENTIQGSETCKYEIDTDSDDNLTPIRMLRALYPNKKITDLNKSIDKTTCIL